MARRDRLVKASSDHLGKFGQAGRGRVERLVSVQVDANAVIGGCLQEKFGRTKRVTTLKVRASADEISSRPQRVVQQSPLIGASGPHHWPAAQRHDLDVDHVGNPAFYFEERLDTRETLLQGRVGVAAHGSKTVG